MMRLPTRLWALFLLLPAAGGDGLTFQGPEVERFLIEAAVTRMRAIGRGVSLPRRVTLTHGEVTHDAAWKTINESRTGVTSLDRGRPEMDFEDTYRAECAAYELDRMLGLGMVPASVERVISGERGALILWIAPGMPEAERYARRLSPPDVERWNREMFKVRLFDNLIYNTDRNLHNILITPEWEIRLIDHSRAFRKTSSLREPKDLGRFSRSLLDALARLDETGLRSRLERYLSLWQIRALLTRRDRILELATDTAVRRGAAAVYYP